ncbi:amidohydrolase [Natribacillus halophilus]|uniref:5-methylthioadenosine/S-adenosylhomocysteine deaminase n=1 Tax=Natribacillus halophilus TaxID=549003 RepID=A0A1G8JA43_9BACI|nr:amidohydrolase [Natribacillus halophilus]SDI28144.1 5-methylthioadenosine/S-adenosylhomocysteine deaminase [Natribacillus halophilus]
MTQRSIVENVTVMDATRIFSDAAVKVKGKKIVAVARSGELETDGYERIDGRGKILMPGLVNTHGHTPMTLLRGISDDLPLDRWLREKIWPAEATLDEESAAAGTALAIVEMLRSGTTCFADMYHLNREGAARITEETGLKASLARGMIVLGSTKTEQKEKLNAAVAYANACENAPSGRLRGAIFPHAPYTCPPDFLHAAKTAADDASLPLHIHIAETRQEVRKHEATYGQTPVTHLLEAGILAEGSLAVHAVHVNETDITGMKEKGVHVSHNPQSNLKLGSGIAPLPRLLNEHIPVSLGTDSAASNNTLDLFDEMRQAAMIHKGTEQAAEVTSAQSVVEMATVNGARTLGFPGTGLIEEGYDADFILIDTGKPHLIPRVNDYGSLVYAASGQDVTDVFVEGRALMRRGELLTIDEEKVCHEAINAQKKWKADR